MLWLVDNADDGGVVRGMQDTGQWARGECGRTRRAVGVYVQKGQALLHACIDSLLFFLIGFVFRSSVVILVNSVRSIFIAIQGGLKTVERSEILRE